MLLLSSSFNRKNLIILGCIQIFIIYFLLKTNITSKINQHRSRHLLLPLHAFLVSDLVRYTIFTDTMRRLYEIMRNSAALLVIWLAVLLFLSLTEMRSEAFSKNVFQTYTFVVLQLPLHALVLFGSYALCSIGWHLIVLGKLSLQKLAYLSINW